MKKKIIIGICILIVIVCLIPIPMRMKDGGTVVYSAVLYSVEDVHRLKSNIDREENASSEHGYFEGTVVRILGMEIYNDVK